MKLSAPAYRQAGTGLGLRGLFRSTRRNLRESEQRRAAIQAGILKDPLSYTEMEKNFSLPFAETY